MSVVIPKRIQSHEMAGEPSASHVDNHSNLTRAKLPIDEPITIQPQKLTSSASALPSVQLTQALLQQPPSNIIQPSPSDSSAYGITKLKNDPVVLISKVPTTAQRSEYLAYPEIDAQITAGDLGNPRKRKRVDADPMALLRTDNRAKAEAAVDKLQTLLDRTVDTAEESGLPISSAELTRLDLAVEPVNSLNVLSALPVGDLLRFQALCERMCVSVLSSRLAVTEEEDDYLLTALSIAHDGMLAAKVALKVIIGAPEEKQLASEEMVQTIVDAIRFVVDKAILPVVKARPGGSTWSVASMRKKPLLDLLYVTRRTLRLLGKLVSKVNIAAQAQESIAALANELLFSENATSEKESILGIQQFESARREAMDVIATMVSRYPDRADSACREALSAMKDLPAQPHRARQFRLRDGTPIQLVTALFMRVIQTTATAGRHLSSTRGDLGDSSDEEHDDLEEYEDDSQAREKPKSDAVRKSRITSLNSIVQPLSKAAWSLAVLVMKHMVDRASTASKTGESPFQRLLELLTEDLVAVLGSPEWSAADVLLTALFTILQPIAKSEDESVQARGMALDFMGLMGTGIYGLRKSADKAARKLDKSESQLNAQLSRLTEQVLSGDVDESELFHFDGPYRVILEFLLGEGGKLQISSAIGSRVTEWTGAVINALGRLEDSDRTHERLLDVATKLRRIIVQPKWLVDNYESQTVVLAQAQLASMLVTLEKTFCKRLDIILHHFLASLTSSSITLRSRALKSLLLLVKEDSSLLERHPYIIDRIKRLLGDASARVRESALRAFAEVLTTSSDLDKKMYELIIARASNDSSTGVQTAAMKILKDIYKRHEGDYVVQSTIANTFLSKVSHPEKKSIAEPAIQSLEELWYLPLYVASESEERDPKSRQQLRGLARLMVRTVEHDPKNTVEFDMLLKNLLAKQTSKNAAGNAIVCKHLVAELYDELIGSSDVFGSLDRRYALETLAVFARADPTMFTADRLEIMQPYLENLSSGSDLEVYQSVLVIYRHVFPETKSLQTKFLTTIQTILLKTVQKLSGRPLMETALCLQIISEKQNDASFLVRLVKSALKAIDSLSNTSNEIKDTDLVRIKKLTIILGAFGRASKLDHKYTEFRDAFSNWTGVEVSDLIVDLLAPLTKKRFPTEIRETALEAICQICQAWPKQFMRDDVEQAINLVFLNDNAHMEAIVLSAFRDFYLTEERKSEAGAAIAVGEGAKTGAARLGVSLNASENDSASPGIAQKFLRHFTRLALASVNHLAVIATEVLASVSRQGLVHPKECGIPFIALETSPNPLIASLALQEHGKIHEKHESIIEKDYMKAVTRAFNYQADVVGNQRGATISQPFLPKLHGLFEVLKSGTVKVRKKFFTNVVKRLSFDFDKLTSAQNSESDLLFTRFIVENVAFYEAPKTDELWQLLLDLEKVTITAGSRVLEAINQEVLQGASLQLDQPAGAAGISPEISYPSATTTTMAPQNESLQSIRLPDTRLRQITIAAIRLTLIWETRTFLRRLWNMTKYGKKGPPKDALSKPPLKIQTVSAEKYMELTSQVMACLSENDDALVSQCRVSAELLSIDYDHKVAVSDDDGEGESGYETPNEDPDGKKSSATPGSGGRGRKRKLSSTGRMDASTATPVKKKRSKSSEGTGKHMRSGSYNSFEEDEKDWD